MGGWNVPGFCYYCNDFGDPFYSKRLASSYTDGILTSMTHQCYDGYWNSLNKQSTQTATCQTNGAWQGLIECSACKVPANIANDYLVNRTRNPSGDMRATRIRKRSAVMIGGFAPAHEIEVWCHPFFAPTNLVSLGLKFPTIHQCSNATGVWSGDMPTCVLCRVEANRRRCSNPEMCARQACKFGPWQLPVDLHGIHQYA
jgi:hypothetical protein